MAQTLSQTLSRFFLPMVFVQWIQTSSPLARNIARKVLRIQYAKKIKELQDKGIPPPPTPETMHEAKLVDGEYSMKTGQIFEEGLKMEEGKIDPPPYEGGQFLKQHDAVKNPRPPAPPYPEHTFRSKA